MCVCLLIEIEGHLLFFKELSLSLQFILFSQLMHLYVYFSFKKIEHIKRISHNFITQIFSTYKCIIYVIYKLLLSY